MERTLKIVRRPYESILDSWKKQNRMTNCEKIFGGHEYAYIGNNIWLFRNGQAMQLDYSKKFFIYGTWDFSDGSITFDDTHKKYFSNEQDFYNALETARFVSNFNEFEKVIFYFNC